jgi:hypothetical protein
MAAFCICDQVKVTSLYMNIDKNPQGKHGAQTSLLLSP